MFWDNRISNPCTLDKIGQWLLFKMNFQDEYDLDDFEWDDEEEDTGKDELWSNK